MSLSRSVYKAKTYLTAGHNEESVIKRNNTYHYSAPNELIINSLRKKKRYGTSAMKNELRKNIHSICEEISQDCQVLINQIQLSTNDIPNEKDILDSQKPKDSYMISLKNDIQSYAKDLNKKGTFISIKTNNNKGPRTIFLSQNNNNIFAKVEQVDRLTPNATMKYKNKLVNDYDLYNRNKRNNKNRSTQADQQEKLHRTVLRLHNRFFTTYNKELDCINHFLNK